MKKITSRFCVLSLLVTVFATFNAAQAQTVATPTVYTTIAAGSQTVTGASISGADYWFRWTSDTGIVKLDVKLTDQGTSYQNVLAEIYTVVSVDSIRRVYADSLNSDSTMHLVAGYVASGDKIYIRFVNKNGTCGSCTYANPRINFTIYSTTSGCSSSPCSLVRNGTFEQATSGLCAGYNITDGVDCWYPYENSTDVFRRNCYVNGGANNLGTYTYNFQPPINSHNGSSNNTIMGQYCYTSGSSNSYYIESVQSLLASPLLPGHTYELSFWGYNPHDPITNPMAYPCWVTFATSPFLAVSPSTNLATAGSFPGGLNVLQNFPINSVNTWTAFTYTFTFSGSAAYNLLVGINYPLNLSAGNINYSDNKVLYAAYDDIEIKEITTLTATSSTTICAGQTATLSASGMTSYNWQPGNVSGATITANPIATTVYTVTGTDAGGCTKVKTVTVTVNPLPPIIPYFTSVGICPGSSVTLGAYGGTSYTWAPCSVGCNLSSLVVNPSVNTTYTVTGLASGCTNTATTDVYILNPNNSINITGYTTICKGELAYLSATGATNYTWSPCSSGCNSPTMAPSPSVTTTYTVRGVNACGVLSTSTVVVTVKPSYAVDPAVLSNPICSGNSVSLIANGGSPYSYTWTPGNVVGTMISVTPSVTTSYTACTSVPGCTNNCAAVTVTVLPVPQLTVSPVSFTVCAGTPTTITASGASTYTWSPCSSGCNSSAFTVTSYTNPSVYTVVGTAPNSCTNSVQSVATVITPTNSLQVGTASATICIGNSITLTASGSPSYTWTPCVSGCNSSSVSVSPTVTTTYTVSGLNNCGNVITKTVNIVVTPPYVITANAQPNVICAGSSSTLTATSLGHVTYYWDPIFGTGSPIVVTPTVTTTYTVYSIIPNCGMSQTLLTVTVNAVPLTANLSTSSNFVCASNVATLTANVSPAGTYTYNWSPFNTQTTSPNYTFTPTNNTTYVYTASNACGAVLSNTVCIDVVSNECCVAAENMPANTTIGNASVYTNMNNNGSWNINGPITITGNVTWSNNTYRMLSGAKITIVAGAKLTLNNCRLFSCTDMWEGIILVGGSPPASPKIEVVNSTIEDAYRAIYYDVQTSNWDDNIITRGSTFNKNYIGIDVINTSATPVSNTVALALSDNFKSAASLSSPGSNLKCSSFYTPTIKTIAYAGVYFDNQNSDLHLGDATFNVANTNTYDNLNYGVYLRNALTRVFKSNFTNLIGQGITGTNPPPPIGIGIYSTNSYSSANHMAHAEQCTFTNVYRGMHTEDINKYYVLNCQFSVTTTDPYYTGNMASYANNAIDYSIVQVNNITNFNTGIYHGYSSPVAASNFSLSVFQNTVTAGGTGTAYCQQAIALGDAVNTFSAVGSNLTIAMNKLSNVQNGISVTNVKNGLKVSNNTVGILYAASGTFVGMKFNGSGSAYIDNNTISSTSTGNVNLRGIYMQLSPNCYNRCNTINNTGQAILYEGNCLTGYAGFGNNIINNAYDGVVLKNNGVIGTQGRNTGLTSSRSSSGNQWLGTFTNSKTLVMDAGSSATNSNLQVRNNSNENPAPQTLNKTAGNANPGLDNFGTSATNTPASLIISTYANQACPSPNITGMRMASMDSTDLALIKAERDSVLFRLLQGPGQDAVLENETRELNRNYVYGLLDNGYQTTHAGLNAFYTQQSDSTVNVYNDVDSLILSGNYAIAQNQNNAAAANTLIQQNQQLVNAALLKHMTQAGSFTQPELDDLNILANKCPLMHGSSVYQARALLCALTKDNLIFNDNCNVDNKSRKAFSNGNTVEESINLFPNPSKGAMTVKYKINQNAAITIYDISGRILYKHVLDKEATSLQLQTSLAEGMYIYTIINDIGTVLKTDKLVIIQ